ncbi:MAG: elongation factor G [Kiritimatiellaeota bacterium]|nr:elongation factor G [Kiritimatiellota bacterium]
MQELDAIRNVGIIAHIDAGKTTTTEGMLFYSGRTHRFGNIDDGTTVMDYLPEERERGITITAAAATFPWADHLIHLIDTPGHIDFTAEVERSLRVIDGAVVIFSAVEGVEAQSEKVWRQAEKYNVAKIAFINKLDRIGASFERVLNEINEKFGDCGLPVQMPIGAEQEFERLVDLVHWRVLAFAGEHREEVLSEPVPSEIEDAANHLREQMIERLADESDEIAAAFLEGEEIAPALLVRVIREQTRAGRLVPILVGTAKKRIGIQPLMDAVIDYLPSPGDVGAVRAHSGDNGDAIMIAPDPSAPFGGLIFKLVAGGSADLLYVRTYAGTLKEGATLVNARTRQKVRAKQILRLYAKNTQPLPKVGPGDIVGVIGPRGCETGDTLCERARRVEFERIVFPDPVISMAVEPRYSRDKERLDEALKLLCREDPTLELGFDSETGQRLLAGMGELHLEINLNKLKVETRTGEPRVAYRETFGGPVHVTGTFHKLFGDTELFAELSVAFQPLPRGDQTFQVSECLPGKLAVPKTFIAAAEKALADGLRTGGAHGYPLIYVAAEITNMAVSPDKTTEPAVIGAALAAVDQAITQAGTVVLEPLMRLEVFVPLEAVGEVTGYLQPRRAVIHEMAAAGAGKRIACEVPLAEMFGFSKALPKLTGGRGVFTMVPCGYQALPPEIAKRLFGVA